MKDSGNRSPQIHADVIVPIDSLATLPTGPHTVTVRGVVTLTSPLYVQDSSGSSQSGRVWKDGKCAE